jgi:hypothetical protein
MSINLKNNNYLKKYKKTLILPHFSSNNIFRLDMQEIISDISNQEEKHEEIEEMAEIEEPEEKHEEPEEKHEETEEIEEESICRICFEEEIDISNKLISPCLCRGTQKYIHNNCLKEWRIVNENNPEKRDKCEICNFHFVINNRQNYSIYIERNDFILIFLRHIFIFFSSIIYGIIDYSFDFFTVKTLNVFSTNDFKILRYFKEMKYNINYEYIIIIYSAFIFCFINFLYYLGLTVIIFNKRKRFQNIEYKGRVIILERFLKYQQLLFPVFYYIGLIMDDFDFFSCLLPFVGFINTFSYNLYIMKSNGIIEDLDNIDEEVIYSFENNPMLGIEIEDI